MLGQGLTVSVVGVSWDLLDSFSLANHFCFLSPSLWSGWINDLGFYVLFKRICYVRWRMDDFEQRNHVYD